MGKIQCYEALEVQRSPFPCLTLGIELEYAIGRRQQFYNKQYQFNITEMSLIDLKLLPRIISYSRISVCGLEHSELLCGLRQVLKKLSTNHHYTNRGLHGSLSHPNPPQKKKKKFGLPQAKKFQPNPSQVTCKNSREKKKESDSNEIPPLPRCNTCIHKPQNLTQNNVISPTDSYSNG